MRRLLAATCVGTLLMCGSAAAAPAPVVDQSFTTPGNLTTSINDCCAFVAQTFTADEGTVPAALRTVTQILREVVAESPPRSRTSDTLRGKPGATCCDRGGTT